MKRELGGLRGEALAVATLTVLGAVIRLRGIGRLGLTHFDEGIYAASGLWVFSPNGLADFRPGSIAYAPPGYPLLVGLSYFLGGAPTDLAAIGVSLLAGISTIPVASWLARRTFGPGAGVGAAAFAALCGPHVVFSRMALTDSTFLLAWMVAIGQGMRFLEQPRIGRAFVFGLSVGISQLCKYNGWLNGVVVLAAAWPIILGSRRFAVRTLALGSVAFGTALVVNWPWFRFVEGHGGYSSLLAHQRSYLGSVGDWVPHLKTQLAEAFALSGGRAWIIVTWILGGLGGLVWSGRVASRENVLRSALADFALRFGPLGLLATVNASLGWLVAIFDAPSLVRSSDASKRVVGCWVLILSVLTPWYHPYARLWLPLHGVTWIVLGGLVANGGRELLGLRRFAEGPWWRRLGFLGFLALGVGLTMPTQGPPRSVPGWLGPTDGLRRILWGDLAKRLPDANHGRVLSLARPTVAFYLAGKARIVTVPDMAALVAARGPGDWVLLDGAQLSAGSEGQSVPSLLGPADSFEYQPGVATLLDEDPDAPFRGSRPPARLFLIPPTRPPSP